MFSIFAKQKPIPDPTLVVRGRQAADLLKSELFHACVESLEKDVWKQFMDTAANAPEDREVLYRHVNALRNIKDRLAQWAAEGRAAEVQMKAKGKSK